MLAFPFNLLFVPALAHQASLAFGNVLFVISQFFVSEENWFETNGYGSGSLPVKRRHNRISQLIASEPKPKSHIKISLPEDFRRVSAIIDVDIVPESHRRVKLMKNGSDKPLGFYIRDGTSVRVTPHGLEKVPGIFISRLVPGGLAESTGLLAVNDEVIEVNGIEVEGKTLDQVTDMMVANSSNLIITVKPANQRNTLAAPKRGELGRNSQMSQLSMMSASSTRSMDSDEIKEIIREDDEDEVEDHTTVQQENKNENEDENENESENKNKLEIEGIDETDTTVTSEKEKEGDNSEADKDSAVVTL